MRVSNYWQNFHFWVNYPFKSLFLNVKFLLIWAVDSELRDWSVSLFSTGWMIVESQMKVVLLWLQLWDQTLHTWDNWICLEINYKTQEWICSLMHWRILTVNWRYCGKILYIEDVVLIFIWFSFHTEFCKIMGWHKKGPYMFCDTDMNSFKHYVEPDLLHGVFYCLSNHFQTVQKRQTCMNNLTPCLYLCQAHKKRWKFIEILN